MVTSGLYSVLFTVIDWFLPLLPDVTWSVDSGVLSYFIGILENIAYLLPMGHVGAIFGVIVGLMGFRITVALARTLWDVLPVV